MSGPWKEGGRGGRGREKDNGVRHSEQRKRLVMRHADLR